jgi:hypothetical protein
MNPSITISASAGTSRSQVSAFTSFTGFFRRKPAKMNSSMFGGSGALAEYIDAGSEPITMQTGIFSPFAAISAKCAAPVLWRCQCIATVFLLICCTRYMPTFLMPRAGSLLTTAVMVRNGPPSSGQVVSTGSLSRSISLPCQTIS